MKIYLSNRAFPGTAAIGIQARPLAWMAALPTVPAFVPAGPAIGLMARLVADRKAGKEHDPVLFGDYRIAYEAGVRTWRNRLAPGVLADSAGTLIGDAAVTLICTCSREEARAGRCHRVWAAQWLERAGWEVWEDYREKV